MRASYVLLDTNVLINFFRKSNKRNSAIHQLRKDGKKLVLSAMVVHEIFAGHNQGTIEHSYWSDYFKDFHIIPYTYDIAVISAQIERDLKKLRMQIGVRDAIIAATALHYQIPLVTANTCHFELINSLKVISIQGK